MEWKSEDILVGGYKVHYYRSGGNKPPFVLAHGATDDGMCWESVAKVLAHDYDVIMVDALGHGLSDSPEGSNTLDDMADILAGVIKAQGLEKPLVLGHSMGAVTALGLAGRYPDLPRAILVEDPPPWWQPIEPPKPADQKEQDKRSNWWDALRTKTREELLADGKAQNPHWSEAEFGPWVESKIRFAAHDPAKSPFKEFIPTDFPSTVGRITCPVLLMIAEHGKGAIVQERDLPSFQTLVPQAVVKQIEGAGHNIRRDRYDAYMAVVDEFLAGLG